LLDTLVLDQVDRASGSSRIQDCERDDGGRRGGLVPGAVTTNAESIYSVAEEPADIDSRLMMLKVNAGQNRGEHL